MSKITDTFFAGAKLLASQLNNIITAHNDAEDRLASAEKTLSNQSTVEVVTTDTDGKQTTYQVVIKTA